mmetsp:Transcript_11659/g.48854  ORF Transcript_11659/g.48854 Transcript_11659/m.48854 type:complete len:243 (-) Transcript_11659:14-742(-)
MRARDPSQVQAGLLGVSSQAGQQAAGPDVHLQVLLRHLGRWRGPRARGLRAVRQRHAQDVRELQGAVHRRNGRGQDGQAPPLQGLLLPPRHPQLHVPGWRLHQPQRHRRQVHLRRQVRRRELPAQAHRPRHPLHGQRGSQHQRIPVFPLHRADGVARRQARRLRLRHQGHGRRPGRRGGRHLLGQDHQAGRHRRLRPALLIDEPVIDERFNVSMNAGSKKQPPGRGSTELAIGLLNIITRSS